MPLRSYYAQGVSVTTAVLPAGWRERLVTFHTPGTGAGRGLCPEPHDLVVSKLVAHREKDLEFAAELLRAGLAQTGILQERIASTPISDELREILRDWVTAAAR